ncbi:hypothetical protein RHMOL_Rhmol08G0262800 [Rhododendron molle]|uniref:Uncharacterized protein n=1 Tax=Rhododendron molle TaxID=49168 RepID=A0ACC0MSJ3_RHOML|nr:hypothetical protein RHMOL_Rhmol08G0262800 [Rhododendron molle]
MGLPLLPVMSTSALSEKEQPREFSEGVLHKEGAERLLRTSYSKPTRRRYCSNTTNNSKLGESFSTSQCELPDEIKKLAKTHGIQHLVLVTENRAWNVRPDAVTVSLKDMIGKLLLLNTCSSLAIFCSLLQTAISSCRLSYSLRMDVSGIILGIIEVSKNCFLKT